MLTALSAFFYRIASWKTLLLAIALYVPFPAYILKNLETEMNALAGKKIGPIDLLLGYDPGKITQMVADYGPEARALYAKGELTADIAYPLIYTFLFCIILSLIFRNRSFAPFQRVNALPLIVWVLDIVENICIVYLLKSYPQSSEGVASICSILTNLKWAAFAVVVLTLLYGLVQLIISRRQSQLS